MKITDVFINRSVTTLTLMGAIIVFGLFGFRSMGVDLFPEMAIAIIGGMITATLLTLVVIPVVYLIFDDTMEWIKARLSSLFNKNTFATQTN